MRESQRKRVSGSGRRREIQIPTIPYTAAWAISKAQWRVKSLRVGIEDGGGAV